MAEILARMTTTAAPVLFRVLPTGAEFYLVYLMGQYRLLLIEPEIPWREVPLTYHPVTGELLVFTSADCAGRFLDQFWPEAVPLSGRLLS